MDNIDNDTRILNGERILMNRGDRYFLLNSEKDILGVFDEVQSVDTDYGMLKVIIDVRGSYKEHMVENSIIGMVDFNGDTMDQWSFLFPCKDQNGMQYELKETDIQAALKEAHLILKQKAKEEIQENKLAAQLI